MALTLLKKITDDKYHQIIYRQLIIVLFTEIA